MLTMLDVAKAMLPDAALARVKEWDFVARLYDRAFLSRRYHREFGRWPNLRHPKTFNEKVIFKILNDRRPLLTQLADKVMVRDYVAKRIGPELLSEVYQICGAVDQIQWDRLPQDFAIKMNHGSKMNIMVYEKTRLDVVDTTSKLQIWLNRNFYHHLREWCYRDIRPLIMFEELLHKVPGQRPVEWKFYVFNGHASYLEASSGPDGDRKKTLYDRSMRRVNGRWIRFPAATEDPVVPGNLTMMMSIAEELAGDLDFVRVDLYNVEGRIVFGELTNYPSAGLLPTVPPEFDEVMGREWRCPSKYEQSSMAQ